MNGGLGGDFDLADRSRVFKVGSPAEFDRLSIADRDDADTISIFLPEEGDRPQVDRFAERHFTRFHRMVLQNNPVDPTLDFFDFLSGQRCVMSVVEP